MKLEAARLSVRRGRREVLDQVSLSLEPGTFTALVGPNGAGKSTLLECLSGALRPDSGRITLDNQPIERLRASAICQKISYLPQRFQAPFAFTVGELLDLTPHPRQGQRAEILEWLGLSRQEREPLTRLSGGERQRAVVARALLCSAPILLLDEAATSLDLCYQRLLLQCLQERARQGEAVLLVTHDLAHALECATHIALLKAGRLLAHTPADALHEAQLQEAFDTPICLKRDPCDNIYLTFA